MSSFHSPKNKSTPGTPDSSASTILDDDTEYMDIASPTNEYCQNLETRNVQLLRENKRLKQEIDYYRPKPGETPSTVLQIKHNDTEDLYYALDLVPYTTEHRKRGLQVRNRQGELIGTVNMDNELASDFEAEYNQNKRNRSNSGGKKCITRRKRRGNKKSCKRTKKH